MGVIHRNSTLGKPVADTAPPRAIGDAQLAAKQEAGATRIKDLRQSGALKLVFPRTHGQRSMDAVIVNTAGGVTGGDRFFLTIEVGKNAHLRMTTQAAERAYRALQGAGHVNTKIHVQPGGRLDWLPQETILFEASAMRRRLNVDLNGDAQLLLVDALVFGREAMGEDLQHVVFDDRIMIRHDGVPRYIDGVQLTAGAQLRRPSLGANMRAMAQLVFVHPSAMSMLSDIRAHLPKTGGASLIGDDMLVVRLLADDGYTLRQSLLPMLDHLTNNTLPTSWRL